MVRKLHFMFLLSLVGCAAGTREPCPTAEAEPISTCRAVEKCRDERSTSPNVGIGISQSQGSESYKNCINQDLKDQETQAQTRHSSFN